MSERKLAHMEKVVNVRPIPGADRIELVTVLGWECVVKKNKVKIGDLVGYVEVDSIVPAIPYFDFMEPRRYRVKTIKLQKQISQGLVIPLEDIGNILAQMPIEKAKKYNAIEGADITEALGITKYVSPSDRESSYEGMPKKQHHWFIKFMTRFAWYRKLFKKRSKSFPDWIAKTDEERIQNIPRILEKFHEYPCYVTEKVDGQSGTFWYKHKTFFPEFGICSREVRKFEIDGSNWSITAKTHNLKQILKKYPKDIAIQGEVCGPKIQGNKYKLKAFKLFVFNIYDIKEKRYFTIQEVIEFCKSVGLDTVPILDMNYRLPATVNEMLQYANAKSVLFDTLREGVVVRTHDKSMSFKAINQEFQFAEKDEE
jgi:hypothetical protein